jgi:hypothetical protein
MTLAPRGIGVHCNLGLPAVGELDPLTMDEARQKH